MTYTESVIQAVVLRCHPYTATDSTVLADIVTVESSILIGGANITLLIIDEEPMEQEPGEVDSLRDVYDIALIGLHAGRYL